MTARDLAARIKGSRFLRFAVVGTAGFTVNEAALTFALLLLHLNAHAAWLFAFAIAVTFTWWGNRTFTFREHAAKEARDLFGEWVKFVIANGLGFVVNFSVYSAFVGLAPGLLHSPFVALAFGTLAGLLFNFSMSRRFVFAAKK